jgi:ribosomal protein S9
MNAITRMLRSGGLILGLVLLLPGAAGAANDFSAAEQALFIDNQLGKLQPPLTLHYDYRKTGTLEEAFDDKVDVVLTAKSGGVCCAASARFFTGARAMSQPDVEGAQGNPAILYFLERDIREMERLTKGKANYFRQRIRMAIYQDASIRNLTLLYRGRPVAVQEISISPYLDDPNRPRYEKLVNKQYLFMLAAAVPGGLYGIRTQINAESANAPPLIVEEMLLDGAEPAPPKRQP